MKVKRVIVYPYKKASESGKAVAKALNAAIVTAEGDFTPKDGDLIFDWGSGYKPIWAPYLSDVDHILLNHWDDVCHSVNKITSFSRMKKGGAPTPPWSENHSTALKWSADGKWVCCRQQIEGMDGAGLVLAKTAKEMVNAKLYTRFMPIHKEFRVYVFRDKMLDIREKRRDSDLLAAGKINDNIRTTSGGWVFCQNNVVIPKDIEEVSTKAVKALGLDWAGVDVIQAKEDGRCYVLETNTAPYVGYNTVSRLAKEVLAL